MKVAAILDAELSAGGGFHQGMNAIHQMRRICSDGGHDFIVATPHLGNIGVLQAAGFVAEHLRTGTDRVIVGISESKLGQRVLDRCGVLTALERKMLNLGVDIVYFVCPTSRVSLLRKLNFISTVWDLSHRDTPEFPEVRPINGFYDRERFYRECLGGASLIITDSHQLSESLHRRYGLDMSRLLAMPFSPTPFLDEHSAPVSLVRSKYALPANYLFFPAQFWPHKNHTAAIDALGVLKRRGEEAFIVFAGGDKGNLSRVKRCAEENNVLSLCRFLGFVPNEDIKALYEGCSAVLMPSYFGPTNLPPLEAWTLRRPLIASEVMREFVLDAALVVRPEEPADIANALLNIRRPEIVAQLIAAGIARLGALARQREEAEQSISRFLARFAQMRRTW